MAAFGRRNDPPATPAISFPPGMGSLPGTAPGSGPTIPPPTVADTPMFPAPAPALGWSPAPAYAPAGYGGAPYAPTQPDGSPSPRTVVVSCVLAGIVGLSCFGVSMKVGYDNNGAIAAGKPLSAPQSVGALSPVHTPELDQIAAETLRNQAVAGFPGAVFGAYGRGGRPELMLNAIPVRYVGSPDAALRDFLTGLKEDGMVPVAGKPTVQVIGGEEYDCQRVTLTEVPGAFWRCAWADRRSIGVVVHFRSLSVAEVADAAHNARLAVAQ